MATTSAAVAARKLRLCSKHSASSASLDIILLLVVLTACAFLFTSFLQTASHGAAKLASEIAQAVEEEPLVFTGIIVMAVAVAFGAVSVFAAASELCRSRRRCDNPRCRGLRKTPEFDLRLHPDEHDNTGSKDADEEEMDTVVDRGESKSNENKRIVVDKEREGFLWSSKGKIELRPEHRELQDDLRRLAPPNGRAVLVFRGPCGCPLARLEAWGSRRSRKSKK